MNKLNFSEKMIALRKSLGLTQAELGKRLGISNRAVSKWENDMSYPSIDSLYKLCRMFGVEIEYFFSETPAAADGKPDIAELGTLPHRRAMTTIRELYRVGRGPSSSHTIGPEKACLFFKGKYPDADNFKAVLYGSLAQTGRGHMTDRAIRKALSPCPVEIEFDGSAADLPHPNTMRLFAYAGGEEIGSVEVQSVGGGQIVIEGEDFGENVNLYPRHTFTDIADYCREHEMRLWEYVEEIEGSDIHEFVMGIWQTMQQSIKAGLSDSGTIPGRLNVQKKAKHLHRQQHIDETEQTRENRLVCAYAFAVSEQNACGETIVTAPTCGASGVLPAVLYYIREKRGFSDEAICHALETAAVVGNIVKTNASISGAECGCQAEIGTACAMTAAALAELYSMSLEQIEYAAEIAIEHHLGLT
nr:L-serine ammonia-lyase, iron-sulfur-dependent, subunit alpha [Clostridia bacterium]